MAPQGWSVAWLGDIGRRIGLTTKSPPTTDWSDEALASVIVERNLKQHKELLVARFKKKVFGIVLSVIGPDNSDAEDLTQEILLRVLTKLSSFRGDSKLTTWIYRLAFNAALDYKRRQKRRGPTTQLDDTQASSQNIEHEQNQNQVSLLVRQRVEQLPQTLQIVVHSYYWLDLSIAEIAELLVTPEGTVKSHLHRARKRLAQDLEEFRSVTL